MSFVPEGQHDSSQARSAWTHEEDSPVPAGRLNGSRLRLLFDNWTTLVGNRVMALSVVSLSQLPETIHDTQNQVEHHRTRTFQQQYLAFLKRHQLRFDDKYLWD
jgi:hypothetical protein